MVRDPQTPTNPGAVGGVSSAAGVERAPEWKPSSLYLNPATKPAPIPSEGEGVKHTVFVVEDDNDIARLMQLHLESAGYDVECFQSAAAALAKARKSPPSIYLLDLMLPGMGGLEMCQVIRDTQELANAPVIMVTARLSEEDKVRGLESGADDYVTKPFSPRELVARVNSAMRRTYSRPTPGVLRYGDLELDTNAMVLRVRGEERQTTAMEFRILETLLRAPGRVFTRKRLLEMAGTGERDVSPRSIDVYISRLREKLEGDPENPQVLRTVRGAGYRFVPPDSPAAGEP